MLLRGSPDPLAAWSSVAFIEFLASVLPWWAGRYQRLNAEQRGREHAIVAEQARLRERARIAQDMHDSLGHELALIALHGGALELADGLTEEQRRTSAELRAGAVRATERLHEVVRVLGASDAAAALRPAGETVDDLVRRSRAAGLPVRLAAAAPPDLSPMTAQAVHRVVQEALTNAARHAPGAAVTVAVSRCDAGTRVEVVNEAPARTIDGSGTGLIGLDERVRLAGGHLDAGPRDHGGWRVAAVLPDDGPPLPPSFDVTGSRRLTRRRKLQTAALPVALVLALAAALVITQVLTVRRTGLPVARYDRFQLGQAQASVEPVLPPRAIDRPSVPGEPARPAGADCRYYQAGTSLSELDPQLFRICFSGGVLVAKDRLRRY